jgi:acyl-coenzyme A thioesterase PaaI-like protein
VDQGEPTSAMPEDHYIAMLAIELSREAGAVCGTVPVRPELFAPGTSRIRTALLLTMVDLVAGHAPDGPIGPTVDLRVQILSPPPSAGRVHLRCRPLRVGARLVVAETELRADGGSEPFARSVSTFLNNSLGEGTQVGPRPVPPVPEGSLDAFLGARVADDGRLVVDPVRRLANGPIGTVQGGAQSLLAELAAARVLGGERPLVATDLDIRYLSRLTHGPLAATVEAVATADATPAARVRLTDAGADERLVSFVSVSFADD